MRSWIAQLPTASAAAPGAPLWRQWLAEAGSVAGTLALTVAIADAYAPDLTVFGGQPRVRLRWLVLTAALVATAHLLIRWRAAAHGPGPGGSRSAA